MNLKRLFSVPEHPTLADAALLLLRVVTGLAFILHGWPKIQAPTTWAGPDGPIPGPLLALAALAEFGGGIALVLGLLTPLAALGLAITMAVAFAMHAFMRGDPFVSMTGGPSYELAAVYFCISLLLIAVGPGRLSADRALWGRR